MDLSAIGENLPLILGVVFFILIQFYLRRHKPERTAPEIVQSLLNDIKANLQIIEASSLQQKLKKLNTGSWNRNSKRLKFLDESLQATISDTFGMVDELNRQISAANKQKSVAYLYDINFSTLEKPLNKSKEELEEWLQENIGKKEVTKYPGLFDDFLWRR